MSESDVYARVNAAFEVVFEAADSSVVETAIGELSRGLDELGASHVWRRAVLFNLTLAAMRLHRMTDNIDDLDAWIEWAEEFIEDFANDPERPAMVTNLAFGYASRFRRTEDADDRDSMIELGDEALTWPELRGERRAAMLSELEGGYADRFLKDGAVEDLDMAIDYCGQVLAAAIPDGYSLYFRLGYLYRQRFDVLGEAADADAVIRFAEQALSECGPGHPAMASVLALVADGHRQRYDCVGEPRDLDVVVERLEQALALTPESDPQRARWVSNLAQDYIVLFQRTKRRDALQAGIGRAEEALARMPAGDPDRGSPRSNLATALHERYGLTGDPADLDTSIALSEQNLAAGPTGRSLGVVLSQLAGAHADRALRTGSPRDLDTSVEMNERALRLFGQGGADRSSCLSNLAVCHRRRYEASGGTADLEAALTLGEQALAELDDEHALRSHRQMNLAVTYRTRFERHGNVADLEMAIDLVEHSLAGVFLDADDQVTAMYNLGRYYLERFPFSGDPRDLERGVELTERAAAATPIDHPRWAGYECALSLACLRRYQNGGDDADLDAAVAHIERALAATPPDGPNYVGMLHDAALTYLIWAEHRPLPDEVVPRLVQAASTPAPTAPQDRMRACWSIGQLALLAGDLDRATAMFRRAVEMLPQCTPHALDWSDQEYRVASSRGLVTQTIAIHLAVGDVAGAVELAELGRGIVLSNQLDTRSDTTELRDAAPELADEFERLRVELDTRQPEGASTAEISTWLVRRREAVVRWNQLLARIRRLPGMADFLAPPKIADLQKAAGDGTVVLVNSTEVGSDAVLLRSDSVIRLRLGGLTPADIEAYTTALSGLRLTDRGLLVTGRRRATPDLLAWLWRTIVEPVLDALGYLEPRDEDEPLPRVWWAPTGALGFMPLHAAGFPDGPSALDHVVSSYAPTIRTLLHSKRRPPTDEHRQLTVAMRYTPGLADLPGCEAEARSMQARYPGAVGLANEDATTDAVLAALPDATFAHFACHGSSHPLWPSKCALHLHDGVLPVLGISRLRLRSGELAYLSACSTAHGSVTQADEALHLASAFQLAGYRHVVASLWPLQDAAAARAAHRFYGLLGDQPIADLAPIALHQVVRELRAAHPHAPHVWASLVHSGP